MKFRIWTGNLRLIFWKIVSWLEIRIRELLVSYFIYYIRTDKSLKIGKSFYFLLFVVTLTPDIYCLRSKICVLLIVFSWYQVTILKDGLSILICSNTRYICMKRTFIESTSTNMKKHLWWSSSCSCRFRSCTCTERFSTNAVSLL